MRLLLLALAGTLACSAPAWAQSSAQDALASATNPAERAGILAQIFVDNPNDFVFILQDELRQRGFRSDAPTGRFTIDTIRQLNVFCGEAGIADICRRGPLTPAGATAVATALYAETSETGSGAPSIEPTSDTPAAAQAGTAIVFGPVSVQADAAIWTWAGMDLAGSPAMATSAVDLRRAGIYAPAAKQWLRGPGNYAPVDGSYSIDFTAPADGAVRIYPLRGRNDQSWLYTLVDGLEAGADYTASWHLNVDGDTYAVTDLTVTRR